MYHREPCATFAEVMFWLYRKAHRPALRDISEAIHRNTNLRGTASPETIRRMLRGTTVPAPWETVEAVYLTFCGLAELDPDDEIVYIEGTGKTVQDHVEDAWHEALDNPDKLYRQSARTVVAEDPWAADAEGFGDRATNEPPVHGFSSDVL